MRDSVRAQSMFDAIDEAPMSANTRARLRSYVADGDCDGLVRYLERCIMNQRDVGRSIEDAGKVSFESRMPLVRAIYEGRQS